MNGYLTEKEQQQINNQMWEHNYRIAPYPLESDEAYMNVSQREYFKNILQAWKKDLKKQLTKSKSSADMQLQNHYQMLIEKIDAASQEIDNKEYGYCQNCDQAIGIRRLEKLPLAVRCIVCQKLQEIKEGS